MWLKLYEIAVVEPLIARFFICLCCCLPAGSAVEVATECSNKSQITGHCSRPSLYLEHMENTLAYRRSFQL